MSRYRPWPFAGTDAREKARPVSAIAGRRDLHEKVADLLRRRGVNEADAVVLPIAGKAQRGTVVLRKSDLAVLGIVPYMAP